MTERATTSFVLLAALVTLPACAKQEAAATRAAGRAALAAQEQAEAPTADAGRMLVRRATLRISVAEVSTAAAEAERITRDAGGYVEQSHASEDRHAVLTLRVPADRLEGVLTQLASLGHVEDRSLSTEDVTEQAIDLEARLANLRAVRDRLKKHLEHTGT